MTEVYSRIWVGSDKDVQLFMETFPDGYIVHCAKTPWHQKMVGYKGSLPKTHPNYMWVATDDEMALNLIDYERFDERFYPMTAKMLDEIFPVLEDVYESGRRMLFHCNQGQSRGPMMAMWFHELFNEWKRVELPPRALLYNQMKSRYDNFKPKAGISTTVSIHLGYKYYTNP